MGSSYAQRQLAVLLRFALVIVAQHCTKSVISECKRCSDTNRQKRVGQGAAPGLCAAHAYPVALALFQPDLEPVHVVVHLQVPGDTAAHRHGSCGLLGAQIVIFRIGDVGQHKGVDVPRLKMVFTKLEPDEQSGRKGAPPDFMKAWRLELHADIAVSLVVHQPKTEDK